MKFLIVLVVIVTVKTIFGFIDVASGTVYEGSHKTEQVLTNLNFKMKYFPSIDKESIWYGISSCH